MKAVDYLKAKGRMTGNCHILCRDCPFYRVDDCSELEADYPEQAVEIVEKWAKENPVKTYLSVLLAKLPNTKLRDGGFPKFCPRAVFNINQKCPPITCMDCWNREYKEEENV